MKTALIIILVVILILVGGAILKNQKNKTTPPPATGGSITQDTSKESEVNIDASLKEMDELLQGVNTKDLEESNLSNKQLGL